VCLTFLLLSITIFWGYTISDKIFNKPVKKEGTYFLYPKIFSLNDLHLRIIFWIQEQFALKTKF